MYSKASQTQKVKEPNPKNPKERMRKKKATNDPKNRYFKWLRVYHPECIICGYYGEIHHIEFGYKRDDSRVVMLCNNHHSAQSNDGIHHDVKGWYKRFKSFSELELVAIDRYSSFLDT